MLDGLEVGECITVEVGITRGGTELQVSGRQIGTQFFLTGLFIQVLLKFGLPYSLACIFNPLKGPYWHLFR